MEMYKRTQHGCGIVARGPRGALRRVCMGGLYSLLILMAWVGFCPTRRVHAAPAKQAAPTHLSLERIAYYRRALPLAHKFVVHRIAADMLDPADRGNEQYIEATNRQGRTIGYLRDFTGPVSPAAQCPCNPLSLTLVLQADFTLKTLLSPQPLQKYGHAPMTSEEVARLIAILQAAPPALHQVERVEDMLDVTTGATQQALVDVVVPQAALSTRRLAGLVAQTQRILRGAPGDRTRGRLNAMLQENKGKPAVLSTSLAAWLKGLDATAETISLRRDIWHALKNAYSEALATAVVPDPKVTAQLMTPRMLDAIDPKDMASTALRLATTATATAAAAQNLLNCALQALAPLPPSRIPPQLMAQLRGTAQIMAHKPAQALDDLKQAASQQKLDDSPQLHLYLAHAYSAVGDKVQACRLAQSLYRHHPRLPNVMQALAACQPAGAADPQGQHALAQTLRQQEKAQFIQRLRNPEDARKSPILTLQSPAGRMVSFSPADPDKLTLLVFFATWCPHCRAELPQIRAFVDSLSAETHNKVRVVAVRTATERETTSYTTFAAELSPNFPVYVDGTMSGAFATFARAHDLCMTLPTTVVLDTAGRLRACITSGDFRDIAEELHWAVGALTPQGPQAS